MQGLTTMVPLHMHRQYSTSPILNLPISLHPAGQPVAAAPRTRARVVPALFAGIRTHRHVDASLTFTLPVFDFVFVVARLRVPAFLRATLPSSPSNWMQVRT